MTQDVLELMGDDPEPEDFPSRAKMVAERAKAFTVVNGDDYAAGAEIMKRIARQRKFWDSLQRPAIVKAREAHTAAIAVFRSIDDELARAFETVKARCETWMEGQLAEQQRQLEASRQALADPALAKRADAELGEAFDAAVENGDSAKAAHLLNQAAMPAVLQPPPPLPPPPPTTAFIPKVDGVSTPKSWTYDVIDESLVPREYLMLDRKKIAAVVKALKDKTRIAGIAVRPDVGMRVRA